MLSKVRIEKKKMNIKKSLENSKFTLSSLIFPSIQFVWEKTLFHTCLFPFLLTLSKKFGPNYAFLQISLGSFDLHTL